MAAAPNPDILKKQYILSIKTNLTFVESSMYPQQEWKSSVELPRGSPNYGGGKEHKKTLKKIE